MKICVVIEMNGMIDRRVYFDANAFIYAIESSEENISAQLHRLFAALKIKGASALTSEFTFAEVLPKANSDQRRSYLTLMLHSGIFELLPVTRDILIDTADYRKFLARPSFEQKLSMPKLADAVHVVTASKARCDTFVSFDRGLRLPEGMQHVGREDEQLSLLVEELS